MVHQLSVEVRRQVRERRLLLDLGGQAATDGPPPVVGEPGDVVLPALTSLWRPVPTDRLRVRRARPAG